MRRIIVIDTSILCVWLQLPGFTSAGAAENSWDYDRIQHKIEQAIQEQATLVLPLATIIETGNHLSQCNGDRYSLAQQFCEILRKSVDSEQPWAAYSAQNTLWSDDQMRQLADTWPHQAAQQISIGDATIIGVAEYYSNAFPRRQVEIFTGDAGLRAYSPSQPREDLPRRHRG